MEIHAILSSSSCGSMQLRHNGKDAENNAYPSLLSCLVAWIPIYMNQNLSFLEMSLNLVTSAGVPQRKTIQPTNLRTLLLCSIMYWYQLVRECVPLSPRGILPRPNAKMKSRRSHLKTLCRHIMGPRAFTEPRWKEVPLKLSKWNEQPIEVFTRVISTRILLRCPWGRALPYLQYVRFY